MKKAFALMMGIALLAVACKKAPEPEDGGLVFDYKPSSQTVEVVGTLNPATYDWITMSQADNKVTFTVKLNLSGAIRTATWSYSNGAKFTVTQKSGTSDVVMAMAVKDYDGSAYTVNVNIATAEPQYYSGWGVAYGKADDRSDAKEVAGTGSFSTGDHEIKVTPGTNDQYKAWTYVVSTEGDKIYAGPYALVPAFLVRAGDDIQAIVESAPEKAEIRVIGGATFAGPIKFLEKDKNKKISGGWNEDFTEQSVDNLTVIDGGKKDRGFVCTFEDTGGSKPMEGSVEISYFEITNCFSTERGSALLAAGHPIIIHHCYIHDNEAGRGTIITTDGAGSFSSEIYVYSNIITNNLTHGHAPAVEISDGFSAAGESGEPSKGYIIGNLIANNVSDTYDGYCGAIMIQGKALGVLLNNTIINNFNYNENNGNVWEYITIRGYSTLIFANNILVCNWAAQKGVEGWWKQVRPSPSGYKSLFNNIAEEVNITWLVDNRPNADNIIYSDFIDPKTVLANPDSVYPATYNSLSDYIGGNYAPVGVAVGAGTLGTDLKYWGYAQGDGSEKYQVLNVKEMLEQCGTCFTGEPFIKDGKVSIGCFPAK